MNSVASKGRLSRRLVRSAAGGALALALTAVVGTSAALAHSNHLTQGCTGVDGGYTCFNINGIAGTTHVEKFVQVRGKNFPTICNYKALFTARKNGSVYWSRWTSYHQGCFYFYRATRTKYVERNFRDNTYACGSWFENGSRLGTACNWIFRR